MKVLIGSLIKNSDWILDEFLERIYNLDYNKEKISLCFIINDSNDNSKEILENFVKDHSSEYERIFIAFKNFGEKSIGAGSSRLNESDPLGRKVGNSDKERGKLFLNLAILRNLMIKIFKDNTECEYMINIDSDILVEPNTIKLLTDNETPCIKGAMVINDWLINPGIGFNPLNRRCNVGVKNEQGVVNHFVGYELDKIYDVDVTGACFSVHREVCNKSYYKYHPWGEDAGYCVDMPEEVEIKWDTRCNPYHVMEKAMLIQEDKYRKALEDLRNLLK